MFNNVLHLYSCCPCSCIARMFRFSSSIPNRSQSRNVRLPISQMGNQKVKSYPCNRMQGSEVGPRHN